MDSIFGIGIIAILGGLAAVWLVGLIYRSGDSSTASRTGWSRSTRRSRPLGSTIRSVDDGFWIDTSGYDDGDELRYRILSDGRWHDHHVIVESASTEQFIYTGLRPEQVVSQDAAGTTRGRRADTSSDDDRPLFTSRPSRTSDDDQQPLRRSAPLSAERDEAPARYRDAATFSAATPEAEPVYRSAAERDEPSSASTPEAEPVYRSASDSPAAY